VTKRAPAELLDDILEGRTQTPHLIASLAKDVLAEHRQLTEDNRQMREILLRIDELVYEQPAEFMRFPLRDALSALACGNLLGEKRQDAEQPACRRVKGHTTPRHADGNLRWVAFTSGGKFGRPEHEHQALVDDTPDGT